MGKHYGLDVPTLRELRIDVDKEWLDEDGQPRGITELKEVAAAMAQGGIAYRGPDVLEKLVANYGVGYSFLHAKNTGIDEPEWMDIQGLIGYITGGVNRMIAPPTLVIPIPSISQVTEQHSSPPGKTATLSLIIPAPSIGVIAAESWVLIDDCEDAWDEYVQANVTSTADAVEKKIGAASVKMAVADAASVGRLATEAISADLSPYKYLKAWVRSSINLNAADLSILLDEHAQCISPLKDLSLPAITADTWTEILLDMGDTSGLTAIISIGVDMDLDKGIFNFWIDQVRATKGGV